MDVVPYADNTALPGIVCHSQVRGTVCRCTVCRCLCVVSAFKPVVVVPPVNFVFSADVVMVNVGVVQLSYQLLVVVS